MVEVNYVQVLQRQQSPNHFFQKTFFVPLVNACQDYLLLTLASEERKLRLCELGMDLQEN